ncbi:MAG: GNAT family N-acetyltransferase [Clostridiaceae bacterium]
MEREISVAITIAAGNENELIIKDKFGITLGRIFIIDISKSNKFGLVRLKFYKENRRQLSDALHLFLDSAFNKTNLNKVNIFVDEDTDMEPFIENGFSLEGIISESIAANKDTKDEFLVGIDADTFRSKSGIKTLRLTGDGIELEVLTPWHAEKLLNYYVRNEKYLTPFEPDRDKDFYTLAAQRKIISDEYKEYLNGESVSFGIFKGDNLIGKIRLSSVIYGVFNNAFIGYSIDEAQQGKGYMKQAVRLVCKYAFEYMDLHRIEASTLTDNIKSQKVLLSCGFKEVGKSEKYLLISGKWRDHLIFALINDM